MPANTEYRQRCDSLASIPQEISRRRSALIDMLCSNAAEESEMFDEQPDGDLHGECALEISRLRAALSDMLSGWRYIRQSHGDLYGVGWDRAQGKAEAALGIDKDAPVPKN